MPFRRRFTVTRLLTGDPACFASTNCPDRPQCTPRTRSFTPTSHHNRRSDSDLLRMHRTRTAKIHPNNSYNPRLVKRLPMHPWLTVDLLRYPRYKIACRLQ